MRKALGFAPAMTAGLALAIAVELVAGEAWKTALAQRTVAVTAQADPPSLPGPRAKPLPSAILAPVSVFDWRTGQDG